MSFIEALTKRGVNIDAMDDHGLTPIQTAIANGRADVVRFLLDMGATIDSLYHTSLLFTELTCDDPEGEVEGNAIDAVLNCEYYDIIQLLQKRGIKMTFNRARCLRCFKTHCHRTGTQCREAIP